MKNIIIATLTLTLSLVSCKKNDKSLNEIFDKTNATEINQGQFRNDKLDVSGCARIFTKDKNHYLVFEGFKTTDGPDLKVYFSNSTAADNIVSLGNLKAIAGSFSYCIPSDVNLGTHKYVLIYCEEYTKLFGYAILN